MNKYSDSKIIESWKKNAHAWIRAISNGEIESRVNVTNDAILDAILRKEPNSVLDIGCGEGWLVRLLVSQGIDCLGIDVVPELLDFAKEGKGRFKEMPYEKLCYAELNEKFDMLVCNFSLLGKESVETIFNQAPFLLNKNGALIIQTIHPEATGFRESQEDEWREGSWVGFSNEFLDPAPWYYRTLNTWKSLFLNAGLEKLEIIEPVDSQAKKNASIIFVGEFNG